MWCKAVVQAFSVEQHFYRIEADAATVSMLRRAARRAIKRIKDVLELLFGERFAGVFDSQLILVASNFYHAPGIAVAHCI